MLTGKQTIEKFPQLKGFDDLLAIVNRRHDWVTNDTSDRLKEWREKITRVLLLYRKIAFHISGTHSFESEAANDHVCSMISCIFAAADEFIAAATMEDFECQTAR